MLEMHIKAPRLFLRSAYYCTLDVQCRQTWSGKMKNGAREKVKTQESKVDPKAVPERSACESHVPTTGFKKF